MLSLPILCIIRSIMSCKVTGKTNPQIKLFNLDPLFYHFAFIIKIHYTFLIKYIIFLSLICIALWFTITTLFFSVTHFSIVILFCIFEFPFFYFSLWSWTSISKFWNIRCFDLHILSLSNFLFWFLSCGNCIYLSLPECHICTKENKRI